MSFNNNKYVGHNNSTNTNYKLKFNEKKEITNENNESYVDIAHNVIKNIDKEKLTTSKIRGILSLLAEVYKNAIVKSEKVLDDNMKAKIQYLRVKFVYEAGRDNDVKNFVQKAELENLSLKIGNDKKKLENFYHYMEALVAWHRYEGGKD